MVRVAQDTKMQISGQVAIEGEDTKLIVVFSAFPNGDLMVWFLDKGYYQLMALVNQKFNHLATFPVTDQEGFQRVLAEMQAALGK